MSALVNLVAFAVLGAFGCGVVAASTLALAVASFERGLHVRAALYGLACVAAVLVGCGLLFATMDMVTGATAIIDHCHANHRYDLSRKLLFS